MNFSRLSNCVLRPNGQRRFVANIASGSNVNFWTAFTSRLPQVGKLNSKSTLGEVFDVMWTKYPYKLVYFPVAFSTYLWWNLWTPYADEDAKAKLRERVNRLKQLEYHEL